MSEPARGNQRCRILDMPARQQVGPTTAHPVTGAPSGTAKGAADD